MKQGYGSKRKVKAGFFPPLGLGYLATPLLKKGYEIKIIDCSPIGLNNEDVLRIAKEFKPDLFGISAVTAMAESSYELIEFLKKHFPEIPVGFGGPHVNCFKQEVFGKAPSLDFIGFGECEKSFEQFVEQYIETKKLPEDIPGMIVKSKDGGLKINPAAPITHNLDDIEMPAHQLYDYSYYRPMPLQYKKRPAANMITSRGCPWKRCTYCFEAGKAGQVYRRHSPERAVEEIKFLIKTHGVKEISFWDDNFLINQEWIFKFCDLLDKEGIKIPWSAVARVNTITKTMLIRAKKSGLWNIFFGVESGNQDLLDRIKKGITLDQVRQAVKWCNELGIDTRGSLMLALPGETPEKARKTIDYACSLGLTFAQFLPTHPEWGTELYYDALSSGRIVPLYKGRTTPTYIPDGYDNAEQITKMQKLAYRKFYFRPSYIWLHFKRLKDFGKIKQYIDAFRYILGVSS